MAKLRWFTVIQYCPLLKCYTMMNLCLVIYLWCVCVFSGGLPVPLCGCVSLWQAQWRCSPGSLPPVSSLWPRERQREVQGDTEGRQSIGREAAAVHSADRGWVRWPAAPKTVQVDGIWLAPVFLLNLYSSLWRGQDDNVQLLPDWKLYWPWCSVDLWEKVDYRLYVTVRLDLFLCSNIWNVRTLDISNATVEEQWESNSTLKVDKLVTSLLRKWPLNVLVPTGELFFVLTHSALFTPSYAWAPSISLKIHMWGYVFILFYFFTFILLGKSVKNKFLFSMTA
jgi:hypothetical protein